MVAWKRVSAREVYTGFHSGNSTADLIVDEPACCLRSSGGPREVRQYASIVNEGGQMLHLLLDKKLETTLVHDIS
jgi:hypothetical protein